MSRARLVILNSLCILLITLQVQGQYSTDVLEVFRGKSFLYGMQNETLTLGDVCSVLTPTGTIPYQLTPLRVSLLAPLSSESSDPRIAYFSGFTNISEPHGCGVFVKNFQKEDSGTWTLFLNRTTGENVSKEFIVREVVITKDVVPKQRVTIIEGQDLYLRFSSAAVKNLIECSVNWTNGREVILQPGAFVDPLVEYWGAGFQDDCGVKATKIELNSTGKWTLKARNISGEIIHGEFDVVVVAPTAYVGNDLTIVSESYATLYLSANNSKYCLLKSPSSETQEPRAKPCDVIIKSVTKSSQGNWISTFAVPGQLEEIQTNTSVMVIDVETMTTSLTASTRFKGGLDLLCRWTTYKYASNTANFCRFVRPDGLAFSLEDGIGNNDYSYFGEGINYSVNIKDCGITIKSPSPQDEGTWQCVIGAFLNEIKGSFINVPSTRRVRVLEVARTSDRIAVSGGEKEVVVESGKAVTLACKATASLNYCWFKHPNGTILTPGIKKETTATRSTVSYSGLGLALGDCSITLSEASVEDSGEWSCNLGIQGEADKKVSINVRVSDGNIVSKMQQVELNSGNSAQLGCKTVPEGVALTYCRFVRPDGTSFGFTTNNDEVMSRYRYFGEGLERGVCGLKIDPVSGEDFGQWDCFALHVQSSAEGKASITLIDVRGLSGGSVAGIVIGCLIGVGLIGGGISVRYYRRRNKIR